MDNEQNKKYYVNTDFQKSSKKIHSPEYYIQGINGADIYKLSEAITLIESKESSKSSIGNAVYEYFFDKNKDAISSIRIAITGAPGVGKSTFIENFGQYLISEGKKLAVLAIDPSSQISKGSILGDKTRMEYLSMSNQAFIRPTSAGELLGGVAYGTRPAMHLCEAAGFDTVLVETVGVGQSEYLASMMVDITILIIQPGAGDDVQGIKRGIMELADIVIINRAEKDNIILAKKTAADYKNALKLFNNPFGDDETPVILCSSIEKSGFDTIYKSLNKLINTNTQNGSLLMKRKNQEIYWFEKLMHEKILSFLTSNEKFASQFDTIKAEVKSGKLSALKAMAQVSSSLKNLF
jgi:LAO/AO transport system kinase